MRSRTVGHLQRRLAGGGGAGQHGGGDVADALDRGQHRGRAVVDRLLVEVDHSPGVGEIVRHIGDALAASMASWCISASWLFAPPQTNRTRSRGMVQVVEHSTERAGRQHINRLIVDRLRPDHLGLQLVGRLGSAGRSRSLTTSVAPRARRCSHKG